MWWQQVFGLDRQGWSDLAGSASFVVWLFAQSPQLYENYCNSSCEGLSIVFLAQWMAGDVTNLVGCVLTQQLPFQIAVATYFCSIDLCILAQYYHYWRRDRSLRQRTKSGEGRPIHRQYPSMTAPNMRSSSSHASLSRAAREVSPTPSATLHQERNPMSRTTSRPTLKYYAYKHGSTHSYRALSQAARSVADLADEYARRVAKRDAGKQFHFRRSKSDKQAALKAKLSAVNGDGLERNEEEHDDEDNGDVPAQMMNSVLSDSSSSGDFGYGFGTASTVLNPAGKKDVPSPLVSPTLASRGRDMTRTAGKLQALSSSSRSPAEAAVTAVAGDSTQAAGPVLSTLSFVPVHDHNEPEADVGEAGRRSSSRRDTKSSLRRTDSSRSTRSPISNRGTGMVLLGITALYALQWQTKPSDRVGRDVSVSAFSSEGKGSVLSWTEPDAFATRDTSSTVEYTALHYLPLARYPHHRHHRHPTPPPPPPPPSWKRVIGRVSAWICTVLYITSRLPQIWVNLSRKSVQGLSILLFLSAALGNALYSISVLVNPLATGDTRAEYLLESLPFLLGSGGTLIFDGIIVCQWLVWRGNAPIEEVAIPYTSSSTTSTLPAHYTYRSSSRVDRHTAASSNRWASLERQPLLEAI